MLRFFKSLRAPASTQTLSAGLASGSVPSTGDVPHSAGRITRVHAHALSCERGDRCLFEALSFTLQRGELLQVKGPNGSGKTTLLRMLCGFSAPRVGRFEWTNGDGEITHRALPADIGYMGHSPGIKGALSVEENLKVAHNLGGARALLDMEQALERVGLAGYEDTYCRHLSAGQRRRVALARLLVTDTVLWVLDEPLTSLDVDGIDLVAQMLEAHLARGGMAAMSTHQPIEVPGASLVSITLNARRSDDVVGL